MSHKVIADNRKAFFNFEILEKLEVGIALIGCEVKSIRQGHISIKESYVKIIKEELWILNAHVSPYTEGSYQNTDSKRTRKLLAHRKEILKWLGKVNEKGLTIVPLSIYLSKGKVKLSVGLGRAKKQHDKREDLKEKSIQRELLRHKAY